MSASLEFPRLKPSLECHTWYVEGGTVLSGLLLVGSLGTSIGTLIFSTVKKKIHPFFSLISASIVFALVAGMDVETAMTAFTEGMSHTIAGIGLVITLGTVTGILLEKCNAAEAMAKAILKMTGKKHAALGLGITGYFVSIPVFCDSAFVILSPLAKMLSRATATSMTVMVTALAMGLHTTHMLIPPTPGPLSVAGILGADLGTVIVIGMVVSVPVMLSGLWVGKYFGNRPDCAYQLEAEADENEVLHHSMPTGTEAFTPILVPIVLMMLKTVITFLGLQEGILVHFGNFIGTPVIALLVGMLLALRTYMRHRPEDEHVMGFEGLFGEALRIAGQIVLIVGAGGAFGGVLKASPLQELMTGAFAGLNIGILAPFIIGALFRTAIGSGTVAMITAATLLAPMLSPLGFDTPMGTVIAMLACASGGFMVFHGNDDFFWVVTSTSRMKSEIAYKVLPLASVAQALTALACTYLLQLVFL